MGKKRSPISRAVTAWATLAFLRLTAWLPLSLNRAIAVPLGRALACLLSRIRVVAMENIDRAYGDTLSRREKRKIFWGAVDNVSLLAAEFSQTDRIAQCGPGVSITLEGVEQVKEGQGYLCIGAHLGNWELMGPFMATAGDHKVAEVVRPFDDPRVDRAIDRIRSGAGVTTIPKDNAGREIVRLLKEGYLLGVMIDQSPRENGVPVTFFGEPCWATVAPVMIAVRARVPILPVSLLRRGAGTYALRFYPPLEMERTGNLRADLKRNSQRCQDAIEAIVRKNPEQWLWLHRRWKERPRLAEEWKRRESRDT